jgi:hypothetical protein
LTLKSGLDSLETSEVGRVQPIDEVVRDGRAVRADELAPLHLARRGAAEVSRLQARPKEA